MNRLLPSIPAFLLCLAGGRLLPWPERDAPAGVPAMVGWLPNQVEGYEEWKQMCRDAKKAADDAAETQKDFDELSEKSAKLTNIVKLLNEAEKDLTASEVTYLGKTAGNAALDESLGKLKQTIEDLKTCQRKLKPETDKERERDLKKRLLLKSRYEELLEAYNEAQAEFENALIEIRAEKNK